MLKVGGEKLTLQKNNGKIMSIKCHNLGGKIKECRNHAERLYDFFGCDICGADRNIFP